MKCNLISQVRSTIGILSIIVLCSTAYGNQESAEGLSWYLGHGNPNVTVTVTVRKSKLWAKVWSNIPATELQSLNSLLWNKHRDDYVVINDYNKDGFMDIGVMKGSGYGGSNICYSIYLYEPIVYSYNNTSSITVCE